MLMEIYIEIHLLNQVIFIVTSLKLLTFFIKEEGEMKISGLKEMIQKKRKIFILSKIISAKKQI